MLYEQKSRRNPLILFKRSSFSLAETVVSLPLFAIFLFAVLHYYSSLGQMYDRENTKYLALLETRYCFLRLQRIFSAFRETTDKTLVSFSEKGLFHFCYDNGINRDPEASGIVFASLFFETNRLLLRAYQKRDTGEMKMIREESLLENIDRPIFSFGHAEGEEIRWEKTCTDFDRLICFKIKLLSPVEQDLFFEF